MQLPVGLLLLLTCTFLLHHACCMTTVGPSSVGEDEDTALDGVVDNGRDKHLGEVIVNDGEETEPYVEKSKQPDFTMESIIFELEEELKADGVQVQNFTDVLEFAKEYENGTNKEKSKQPDFTMESIIFELEEELKADGVQVQNFTDVLELAKEYENGTKREKSKQPDFTMESIIFELEEELEEDGVQVQNFTDILELAKEYENGTKKGVPTYHHSVLDVGNSNTTNRSIGKRQVPADAIPWEKGIVPYKIAPTLGKSYRTQYITAIWNYQRETCIRFPPWNETVHADYNLSHISYLNFLDLGSSNCWAASIGRSSTRDNNDISGCDKPALITHEIGHALGFYHEQQHPKSGLFITIQPENIRDGFAHNFMPKSDAVEIRPYDYMSLMHYEDDAFTKNGQKTIIPKDKEDAFLLAGSRYAKKLTYYDKMGINKLYRCADRCPADKRELKCQNDGFVDEKCECRCPDFFAGELCEKIRPKPKMPVVTAWPSGSYGLPESVGGCPAGNWSTGYRTHAMKEGSRQSNNYLKPFGTTLVTDHFCMRSDPASASGDWPRGDYCIYQQGDSCPTGFTSGSYHLYDVADRSAENRVSGSLPMGVYSNGTTYFYCCRRNHISVPYLLPREEPFHLFVKSRFAGCPNVIGMATTFYYVAYGQDTDTLSTGNSAGTPWKTKNWNNIHMFQCYFQPINYDCGAIIQLNESNPSVDISGPNYPQHHKHECIWYIKGQEGKLMVMDILDMDLDVDGKGNCGDFLEVRRTLVAQPGQRFCGKGKKSSVIAYNGFILLKLSAKSNGLSSTVRLVSDSEQCYNTTDRGSSYRGKVDYSQLYHKCIPWEQAQHCPVNLSAPKYIHSRLTGHSYCRNPNDLLRPWCYINKDCDFDMCDVCGLGKCHDIHADCAERAARDAEYCSTDEALRVCHKTCNFCQRGIEKPDPTCKTPGLVTNAVLKTTATTGYYFEYECSSGYALTSGNLDRACQKDGSLSGTPPVCDLYIGHEMVKNGRTDSDGSINYMWIERSSSMTFNKRGFIRAWRLYSNREASVTMMVVRPVEGSDTKFTIVGMNAIKAPNGKAAVIPVAPADRISVKAGDIIAWYYGSSPSITYVRCSSPDADMLFSPGPFTVGDGVSARSYRSCQEYSITAILDDRPYLKCKVPGMVANTILKTTDSTSYSFEYECNSGYSLSSGNLYRACRKDGTLSGAPPVCEGYVGHKVVYQYRVDGTGDINYMYTERSLSMTFNRPGTVIAWKLFSKSAADITMMVVRPVDGSDTKFTVVGMNALKAPNGKAAVIPVATADRISVRSGDMIAWHYMPGSNPSIPYAKCSSSDNKVIWAGPGPFAVGEELSGTISTSNSCREYSIGAVIDYGMVTVGRDNAASSPIRVVQELKNDGQ